MPAAFLLPVGEGVCILSASQLSYWAWGGGLLGPHTFVGFVLLLSLSSLSTGFLWEGECHWEAVARLAGYLIGRCCWVAVESNVLAMLLFRPAGCPMEMNQWRHFCINGWPPLWQQPSRLSSPWVWTTDTSFGVQLMEFNAINGWV